MAKKKAEEEKEERINSWGRLFKRHFSITFKTDEEFLVEFLNEDIDPVNLIKRLIYNEYKRSKGLVATELQQIQQTQQMQQIQPVQEKKEEKKKDSTDDFSAVNEYMDMSIMD